MLNGAAVMDAALLLVGNERRINNILSKIFLF
jgi:translation initiation factor 2 gamma subunit (eIF-2gamma)